jgi:putative acetyltransferase
MMGTAIEIRLYEPRDHEAVVTLIGRVLGEYGFASMVEAIERDLAAYGRGAFWVADAGGEIVGTVAVRPVDARTCELKRLYLVGELRGRGLGQRLYRHAEDFARSAGYARMQAESSRRFVKAHGLYERNGFVRVASFDNAWEDDVFEKSLEAEG